REEARRSEEAGRYDEAEAEDRLENRRRPRLRSRRAVHQETEPVTRYLVLLALASASPRAFADPKADAKQHIDKATAAHSAGHYNDALKELTLAYALDPNPELLFAIGQVHMKIGDCTAATTFYERFIATKPDAKEAAIAQKAITSCKDHPREPEEKE